MAHQIVKRIGLALSVATLVIFAGAAYAGNVGLSGKASTLGLGAELDINLNSFVSIRLQYNTFDESDTFEEDGISYVGDLELESAGVILDLHPFGGAFRISGGLFTNQNALTGVATGEGTYDIGDVTFVEDPNDPLTVNADIELGDSVAPYIGFGWGNSPDNDGGLLFSFDLGVLLSGSPQADLTASGTVSIQGAPDMTFNAATDPIVTDELAREEQNLQDELDEFDIYPVVSIGIGYRF